jgi:hypothetical protein
MNTIIDSLTTCATSIPTDLITRGSDVFTAHHSPRTKGLTSNPTDSGGDEHYPPIIRFSSPPFLTI